MREENQPTEGEGKQPPPPTLCTLCAHGTIQIAASEMGLPFLRLPDRYEVAYCSSPQITSEARGPREIRHIVLGCQAFVLRVGRAQPHAPPDAAAA